MLGLFHELLEFCFDASFVDSDFVMSEIDALFVRLVCKAHNPFDIVSSYFIEIDCWEQFLDTTPDLSDLVIFSEVIQNDKRLFKGKTKGLAAIPQNIFHPTIVNDPE